MTEHGAYKHQETPWDYTYCFRTALDFRGEPPYSVVGKNPRSSLGSKRFFDTIFQFLCSGRAFHFPELLSNKLGFLIGSFLTFL